MHIARRHGWEIPESRVTPEHVYVGRRNLLAAGGFVAVLPPLTAHANVRFNPAYSPDRATTEEKFATTYNNYYDFSESKSVWREAQKLNLRPWAVQLDDMIAEPRMVDIDDLLKQTFQEERIYRHRCVETGAMTVPWTGFPLAQLLKSADPKPDAKYVVFETV